MVATWSGVTVYDFDAASSQERGGGGVNLNNKRR